MTKLGATTRSFVIEREMPLPPEKIWHALTHGPLIEKWLMKNDFQPLVGHEFTVRLAALRRRARTRGRRAGMNHLSAIIRR